jgi:Transposase and inactivated derivatives
MLTNNYTTKDYTKLDEPYQLVLPLSLERMIPEDDSVRLLSHLLEELDYTKLYQAYSFKGRKSALDPKLMFKVLTYAYSQNIYSSRKIERSCKRDLNFLWLLAGAKAPDHATIARFRSFYLSDACEDLFYQFVLRLADMEEIPLQNIFIDGTKIEACANKYTFVWKKAVLKHEARMHEQIKNCVDIINHLYLKSFTISKERIVEDLEKIVVFLKGQSKREGVVFVHGKGKHKKPLQRYLETFETFLERQQKYDIHNTYFTGRNSYSKTDTDATFMHMKEDHMRNSQLKPGYNVQIGVESEYIVGVDIFQERSDAGTLIPFLTHLEEQLKMRYLSVVADAGYESEENYLHLEKNHQVPFIKPSTYERWKKRSFKQDISKRENMRYDENEDSYTCHNNKKLRVIGTCKRRSARGYEAEVTIYECDDCNNCPYKEKCTKSKYNKRISVSKKFIAKREVSHKNIISEKGIELRMNRSIQVEGAFGVLKQDYGFTQFLLRGKNKVKTEFLLLCLGYNINKFHAKIQSERCQSHLHQKEIA